MEQTGLEHAHDGEYQESQAQMEEAVRSAARLKEMELRTLRSEELKRIEFRHTIIQLALTGFGAILALGIQQKLSLVLLFYPFLMLWLSLLWRQNAEMLTKLRGYIATHIESEEHQWERALKTQSHPTWNYDNVFACIFIGSELIALGIGIAQNPQNIVFIIIASFCTVITVFLLLVRSLPITEFVDTSSESIS
ncbi:hypothetical protein KSF_093440 [Reticulibacter mediterranei]|uniref:Uncharacterized protein n=1 Tax=Reticulibacter mediterranei TaxID=2778369 RepID=A0A8J3IR89_9CHLR|nr:hypothetical protein [Reticulibacter mediterranei]GHO99296.1 hypothetical protein KSF_093440 [Reticulibacter mediterranei]